MRSIVSYIKTITHIPYSHITCTHNKRGFKRHIPVLIDTADRGVAAGGIGGLGFVILRKLALHRRVQRGAGARQRVRVLAQMSPGHASEMTHWCECACLRMCARACESKICASFSADATYALT